MQPDAGNCTKKLKPLKPYSELLEFETEGQTLILKTLNLDIMLICNQMLDETGVLVIKNSTRFRHNYGFCYIYYY